MVVVTVTCAAEVWDGSATIIAMARSGRRFFPVLIAVASFSQG
jgi:hypothetical protein